jgi:hypothetical protein
VIDRDLERLRDEITPLTWRIIEWKVAYYRPEAVHESRRADLVITDEAYDAAELRYLTLCRLLGRWNTLVHKDYPGFEDVPSHNAMQEVDERRPSVQLVMSKLRSPK